MKKIYFTLIAIFVLSQITHAQWTTSGSNIYNSNTGNVGIGTTTPAAKLDVNGSIGLKGIVTNDIQNITVATDGTYVIASGGHIKGTYTLNFETSNRIQTVVLVASGTQFDYNSSLTILGNTAYSGNVVMSNFRFVFNSDNSIIYLVFDITNRNSGTLVTANFNGIGTYAPSWGGTLPASPIASGIYPFVVNNGNLLVGKASQTNTTYQLDVAGNVRGNSITINATGADFVFNPTYRLTPLPALDTYIKNNHHLPEIASATEMQKNGLDLGENQVKLLQKVEELTLYLIAMNKEEKAQKIINSQLVSELKAQRKQINLLKKNKRALKKQYYFSTIYVF